MQPIYRIMTFVRTAILTTQEGKCSSKKLNSSAIVLFKLAGIDVARRSSDSKTGGSIACIAAAVEVLRGVLLGLAPHRLSFAMKFAAAAHNPLFLLSTWEVHRHHQIYLIPLSTRRACRMDHHVGFMACHR